MFVHVTSLERNAETLNPQKQEADKGARGQVQGGLTGGRGDSRGDRKALHLTLVFTRMRTSIKIHHTVLLK